MIRSFWDHILKTPESGNLAGKRDYATILLLAPTVNVQTEYLVG